MSEPNFTREELISTRDRCEELGANLPQKLIEDLLAAYDEIDALRLRSDNQSALRFLETGL